MHDVYNEDDIVFELLNKNFHYRGDFDCGIVELNDFIMKYASQQQDRNLNKVYVATTIKNDIGKLKPILGYYTLSANSLSFNSCPESILKKVPKHYPIPTIKIGRLARNMKNTKKGFGGTILENALFRAFKISKEIGALAIDVDAKNEQAKEFYKKYEFIELQDKSENLIISIATLNKVFIKNKIKEIA